MIAAFNNVNSTVVNNSIQKKKNFDLYRAVEVNFPFEFLCLYKGCYYFFNIFWGYKSEAGPSELKSKYKYFTASVMTSI